MAKLKWSGPWLNTQAGEFVVQFSASSSWWLLKRRGVIVSKHDDRAGAMRKAGRLHAAEDKKTVAAFSARTGITARKACGHSESRYTYRHRPDGNEEADALFCLGCRVRLGMGPSNDEPEEVQVEMRAAEIEAWINIDEIDPISEADMTRDEINGWASHCTGAHTIGEAGWLASEMDNFDTHETFDLHAWPWDVTRPIAEQDIARIIEQRANLQAGRGDALGNVYADDHAPIEFAKPPTGEVVNTFADWSEGSAPPIVDPKLAALAEQYLASDEGKADAARRADDHAAARVVTRTDDPATCPCPVCLAKRVAKDRLREYKARLIAEQTRHDVAASVARHAAMDPVTITLEEPQDWDEILAGPPLVTPEAEAPHDKYAGKREHEVRGWEPK